MFEKMIHITLVCQCLQHFLKVKINSYSRFAGEITEIKTLQENTLRMWNGYKQTILKGGNSNE